MYIIKAGDGNRTHVSSLEGWCSTIELHPHIIFRCVYLTFVRRAIDGARTRGLDLGKVARYQLRHYRICRINSTDLIIIHDFT